MPNRIHLAPGPIVYQSATPDFVTGVPDVWNLDLIPPSTLAIMMELWETSYPARMIRFHSLRDVYVVGEGLVFDHNLNLYIESITQNDEPRIQDAFEKIQIGLQNSSIPYQSNTMLLCGKMGMSNYGHWLVEMLPMAHLARPWIGSGWGVFLPLPYPWMSEVIYSSLGMLGIAREFCRDTGGWPCYFEEIVMVTGISQVGHYYLPIAVECMDAISNTIEPGQADRVWVSRLDPAGCRRTLVDEAELCRELQTLGWTVINPGSMSLAEQISIAKGARHIAGVAGAGMTNIGFMRPGGRVTCFMPAPMPDIFFLHLAHHRKVTYREVRCKVDSNPASPIPSDGKLLIDLSDVLTALR